MRVTVIPSDGVIIIDAQIMKFPFWADPKIHAIQWYDTYGYIEYTDGKQDRTNKFADVQEFVKAFNDEVSREKTPATTKIKTQIELVREMSDLAKNNLTKLQSDLFPDMLSLLASLPGASPRIKAASIRATEEKTKVTL